MDQLDHPAEASAGTGLSQRLPRGAARSREQNEQGSCHPHGRCRMRLSRPPHAIPHVFVPPPTLLSSLGQPPLSGYSARYNKCLFTASTRTQSVPTRIRKKHLQTAPLSTATRSRQAQARCRRTSKLIQELWRRPLSFFFATNLTSRDFELHFEPRDIPRRGGANMANANRRR